MAASYFWPDNKPTNPPPRYPQKGFSETRGAQIIRTPTDGGPAKQRRRNYRPDTLNVTYIMSKNQLSVFNIWIDTEIRGVYRFYWYHPRTQVQVEARIVPQQDGQLFTINYLAPDYYNVSLVIEIMP